MDQLDVRKFISEKLKRPLTKEEDYILIFTWNRGLDKGKQHIINKIVNFCESEEDNAN